MKVRKKWANKNPSFNLWGWVTQEGLLGPISVSVSRKKILTQKKFQPGLSGSYIILHYLKPNLHIWHKLRILGERMETIYFFEKEGRH